jgi:hypothetical protein
LGGSLIKTPVVSFLMFVLNSVVKKYFAGTGFEGGIPSSPTKELNQREVQGVKNRIR